MGALFGSGTQGGGQGVLGGYQQPNAGIIGILSALQDAGNTFRGAGRTDNFAQFRASNQENQFRQQLISGLTSPDDATRQQAYAMGGLLGVDTKPFQQMRAEQALPGFLNKTTQPQSVTMPSVSAQGGPGIGTITAPATTATGDPMSVQDALSDPSTPPELRSLYAPKLIDGQITAGMKASEPYNLEPNQSHVVGGKIVLTAPPRNNPNEPFNADSTPNKAYQDYQVSIARARAQARADFRAPPKAAAPGAIGNPASLFGGR